MPSRARIRVVTDFVERIVWSGSRHWPYQPGTLFYSDGRLATFRSLRWSEAPRDLLGEQGLATVPLAEIAELHLPLRDAWDVMRGEWQSWSPTGQSRLIHLQTPEGLKLIASAERLKTRALGEVAQPDNWTHVVQPAWSLDALFLKHRRRLAVAVFRSARIAAELACR